MLAGVSGGKAVVATLAYRLASYWLPLLAGAIAYLLYRRRYGSVHIDDSVKDAGQSRAGRGLGRRKGLAPRAPGPGWPRPLTVEVVRHRDSSSRLARVEEGEHSEHPSVVVAGLGEIELYKNAAHVLFDGSL